VSLETVLCSLESYFKLMLDAPGVSAFFHKVDSVYFLIYIYNAGVKVVLELVYAIN
jgi:hypothetical protein